MMAPRVAIFLLLLAFLESVCAVQYDIRGNIDLIDSYDIDSGYYEEVAFTEKLRKVSQRMKAIIGPDFEDFLVYDYKIHGLSTAVFHARLTLISSPSISRQDIIDKIDATGDVQIYFLRKNEIEVQGESLPRYRVLQADVTSCQNGGILLPNATCSCMPYYSGANCEVVSCRNNGVGENGRCICPPGLYSSHCEARSCITKVDSVVDFSTQSLILVINTRSSMAFDLSSIIENIPILVTDYANRGIQLSSFIVTIYRYSGTVHFMETSTFTVSDQLIDYLHSVTVSAATDNQPHLDAIAAAQSTSILMRPKSTVYVFADSANNVGPIPSTSLSNTNESLVVQQTLSWRNKIILVLSQWSSSPINSNGNTFDVLRRVVTAVHGDLLIVDKTELNEVIGHLLYYSIGGQNTFVQYYSNLIKTIPILSDHSTDTSYVLLSVENGVSPPFVQDKNGNVLKPISLGSRFALYSIQNSVSDSITIVGDTIPVHSTRVWFASQDDVLISYSEDDTVDNNYAHTFNGFNQRPSLYSSFASTTGLVVSRLDSFNSTTILAADASQAKPATCIFPYQLNAVTSCTPGPFVHNVEITANNGKLYRAVPGYCFSPDTHTAAPWSCLNNGTRAGTTSCNCGANSNWQGQHCEVPKCQNGGTVDKFPNGGGRGYCVCPFGVTGSFCEIMTCSSTSSDTFQSYNRSFAIVIQNTLSTNQALAGLNSGLRSMLNFGQSTDFEDFVLTTYKTRLVQGVPTPDVSSTKFSSASAFLNSTTEENLAYSYSPNATQPGLFALETTLRSMDYDKSSIFFFTDSASSLVENTMNFTDIVKTAVERQIEISIVIIPPYGSTDFCLDFGSYEIYEILAQQTGGNFLNFCQKYTSSVDPVYNFIASYGSNHHHNEVVAYQTVSDCSAVTLDIYLSSLASNAFVVITSPTIQNFTAQVTDSNTGAQQTLIPNSRYVPFFTSYQIKQDSKSSLKYQLKVVGGVKEQCFVRVTERSQFSAYLGFSPDPSTDRYSPDLTYATHQQPVIHLSSTLQSEPDIQISTFDNTGNIVFSSKFTKRTSGCKYEYIANGEMTCQSAGDTFTTEVLITTNEVTIQRTQRAFCSDLVGCLNGGIMLGGSCQCVNGYGSFHCEVPTCQNGGVVDNFKCDCQTGYDGDTCQYISCNDWNFVETHDPREYNFQQIVFVVEVNTKNMSFADAYLYKNIQSFVDATDDLKVPKQYTLITFDDQNIRTVASTTNKDQIVNAFLNDIPVSLNAPTQVKGLEAINTAYSTLLDLPGIVYVFGATDPFTNVAAAKQRFGVQVNIVWFSTETNNLNPANVNHYYTAIAKQSNGRVLPISPLDTVSMLSSLAATVKENQLILDEAAENCNSGVNFKFPVGSLATTLTLVATGTGISVTVTDENSNNVDLKNSSTFTDANTLIRTINTANHNGGTWNVVVKGTSSCYLQARVNSPLQVIPRFTNDKGQDFGSGTPRVGAGNNASSFITFRIMDSYNSNSNNFGSSITTIEFVDTDPLYPWKTTTNAKNSTVLPRDPVGCASQFVTPILTWTSTNMKFVVRGKDAKNNSFQRTFFFNKNANKSDCINGSTVDNYGFCQCDANHFGDLCQLRKCTNGGISAYGLCDCPNGYYGDYCEKYISA